MSGYIRRKDSLYDPITGALVGYIDANGNEQLGSPVSGAGTARQPAMLQTMAVVGDSFGYQSNVGVGPGLTMVFMRTGGVVVVTGATGHNLYSGCIISALNFSDAANDAQRVVATYISATSFSYPHAGTNGVLAQSASGSIINHASFQSIGFWAHFNRLTNGAYKLVANAGFPGQTTDYIAGKVATWVKPYSPMRCVYLAGANDITASRTVAQTVQSIKDAVDAYPSALWDIFAPSPFNSSAANNTAQNLRNLSRYYPALKKAFAGYSSVRVHDTMSLFGLSTGLAKADRIEATTPYIHPLQRWSYEAAKYIVALDAKTQTPAMLPTTTLDTISVDATSKGAFSNPLYQTPIAATAPTTGNMPTGCTMQITPALAAAAASSLVARADGFGNDWTIALTPDVATTLTMFHSMTTSYFVSGGMIDLAVIKVSVTGLVASKLLRMQLGIVWITDVATYASSIQEASGSAVAVTSNQQDDVTDLIFSIRDIPIPIFATLSLARLDLSFTFAAAGSAVTIKAAQAQVYLA